LDARLEANSGASSGDWWFRRAQQAVTKDRVERWREQLSPQQIALIEWAAGPALQAFGYSPTCQSPAWHERVIAQGASLLEKTQKKFRNLPRLYYHWIQPTQLEKEEALIDAYGETSGG
jgi:hypothetical protein